MSKPKAVPVPEAQPQKQHYDDTSNHAVQEPLSGSKKVKTRNHVSHLNKEG